MNEYIFFFNLILLEKSIFLKFYVLLSLHILLIFIVLAAYWLQKYILYLQHYVIPRHSSRWMAVKIWNDQM